MHLITLYAADDLPTDSISTDLAAVLGNGSVGDPDDEGRIEVEVDAASYEEALSDVMDALAATGLDYRLTFPVVHDAA